MDPELSGNAFRRFVRRRGLSREEREEREREQRAAQPEGSGLPTGAGQYPAHPYQQQRFSGPSGNPVPIRPPPSVHQHGQAAGSSGAYPRQGHQQPMQPRPPPVPPALPNLNPSQDRSSSDNRQDRGPSPEGRGRFSSSDHDDALKPFSCEMCDMTFRRKHHKERHVANIHRQERPFECDICGFAFHQKPNLDRHRATVHQEMKPFNCDECGLAFAKRSSLAKHITSVHEQQRPFRCSMCQASFSFSRDLESHIALHHREARRGSSNRDTGRAGPTSQARQDRIAPIIPPPPRGHSSGSADLHESRGRSGGSNQDRSGTDRGRSDGSRSHQGRRK